MSDACEGELIHWLDGSRLSNTSGSWFITVYCVYTHGDQRWLQLGVTGPRDYSVTLRVGLTAKAPTAREAIAAWLRSPTYCHGDIVSVA